MLIRRLFLSQHCTLFVIIWEQNSSWYQEHSDQHNFFFFRSYILSYSSMACGSNSAASSLAAASAVPNVTNHLSKMLSYMEWDYLLYPKQHKITYLISWSWICYGLWWSHKQLIF